MHNYNFPRENGSIIVANTRYEQYFCRLLIIVFYFGGFFYVFYLMRSRTPFKISVLTTARIRSTIETINRSENILRLP